jgi:glycine/D-amino acid oxidase-like deaminating enzyme
MTGLLNFGDPNYENGPEGNLTDNAVNLISDPKDRRFAPAENDLSTTAQFVRKHCIGVDDRPNYSGTCLHTNFSDNMYVLDWLPPSVGPGHKNVAVFTGGWGFKIVPLIGRILSELVLKGNTSYDISHFKITRQGILSRNEIC